MLFQAAREAIIQSLWEHYVRETPVVQTLLAAFKVHQYPMPPLDHFAVIDLPSVNTGIPIMQAIFERLQFDYRGCDYLPDKQNGFAWLCERGASAKSACAVLPQVVIADFRLEALHPDIARIVSRYASLAPVFPFDQLDDYITRIEQGDERVVSPLVQLITTYFAGRAWPLPTRDEFETVKAANELLAWVLVCGRRPNHFTFSMHLTDTFPDFVSFLSWVEDDLQIPLNDQAGRIKGTAQSGIQQASTHSVAEEITLADGSATLAAPFMEFVWRYPLVLSSTPHHFSDYFTDFIPANANNVVESLYHK